MNSYWKALLTGLFFMLVTFLWLFASPLEANAYDPKDVPSYIKNGWNQKFGERTQSSTSGRRIHYDVYNGHSSGDKNGYRIETRNFGDGSQPYLTFEGWSALIGYTHHSSSNQATYIVAGNTRTFETKIYQAQMINRSASKDIEFNRQSDSGGVWNRCPNGTYNRVNNNCNMDYNNVGFKAWLPLNELFPDGTQNENWVLFIVKEVGTGSNRNVVFDELRLPFDFKQDYGNGEIQLSSGIDAKKLQITVSDAIRRGSPRGTDNGGNYFYLNQTYTYKTHSERYTAIWYGVSSYQGNDNGRTRWAMSLYWDTMGEQAALSYKPIPVTITVRHQVKNSGASLGTDTVRTFANERYNISPKKDGTFKDKNDNPYVADPSGQGRSGTTGKKNMTITFTYSAQLKVCPNGTEINHNEECQVTNVVKHVDKDTGQVLETETFIENVGDSYSYTPKERGTYMKDDNPYVPTPADQQFSGTVPVGGEEFVFYYRLSLPNPTEVLEMPNKTEGIVDGTFYWELRRISPLQPSKLYVVSDHWIEGEHVATRNPMNRVTSSNGLLRSSTDPLTLILDAESYKDQILYGEFTYEYTNHVRDTYICVDRQGDDCFVWEFDNRAPEWGDYTQSFSLAEWTEKQEGQPNQLHVDHSQFDVFHLNEMSELYHLRFERLEE